MIENYIIVGSYIIGTFLFLFVVKKVWRFIKNIIKPE